MTLRPEQMSTDSHHKHNIREIGSKMLHNEGFFYTLLRSSLSSQVCGWIDTLTSFLVFSLLNLSPWLSTAIGAFVGGVCNCIVNYKFTFHAKGVEWRAALTKFAFVWAGSLLLNSFGTEFVYALVKDWHWLQDVTHIADDGMFLAARLFVALMVSLCWNFILQKNFVFRTTRIDPFILRTLDHIGLTARHSSTSNKTADEETTD